MRPRPWRVATAGIALVGALVVWIVATEVFPYHSLNHDEAVYLQQAAMLLEGQLSVRPPVPEVFRPWFFVADGGRLYPKYAPVPAAIFAVGRLLGGYRLALVLVAAGNLALVALVVREVFDRRTGLLAAAFVLSSPLFLLDSSVFLPYAPTTLLNLSFAYGYFRADRTGDRRWAAVAGAAVGLSFFGRPYTAVLFAAPFVVHALWTLRTDWRSAIGRQAFVAALGLAGVGTALAYNAVMTGSPWQFPFEAFAPRDGLGFGRRSILGHGVEYTVELALRANARVVAQFFTTWIAGGLLGAGLAAVGLVVVFRRGVRPPEGVLAGLFASVVVGNLYFWGNYNVLGDLGRTGDGLIAFLGPYYHFDLLVPTAAFAAVGALALARRAQRYANRTLEPGTARVLLSICLIASAVGIGVVTVGNLGQPLDRNLETTETYERAYEPFSDGSPANAVVFVPDPYGDWLNHPFQMLRNDPGFDGRTVYALPDRPFAVADAYPNRSLYRFGYRGVWSPAEGSPDAARLQRVRDVRGDRVTLDVVVGVPADPRGATVRLATGHGHVTAPLGTGSERVGLRLTLANESVRLDAHDGSVATRSVPLDSRDTVDLTVFLDYGAGSSFSYELSLPVTVEHGQMRALTPRVERCVAARNCDGAATYVPAKAPDGVVVETTLRENTTANSGGDQL